MAKKAKELSVEDKLRALYDLQIIDRRVDEIRTMRGELPLEVEEETDKTVGAVVSTTKVFTFNVLLALLTEPVTVMVQLS